MNDPELRKLLEEVAAGSRSVEEAEMSLRDLPYENLGFAELDHHRALRKGVGEVIYGEGKTPEQVVAILHHFVERDGRGLVTRVTPPIVQAVQAKFPKVKYFDTARLLAMGDFPQPETNAPYVAVVTAGTSDIPVAEEAAVTLEYLGRRVERVYDVGVAGLHRVLDKREKLWNAGAVIAIAGMEGALASVVGGLVACPVVAVPTSIGYGANFKGVAALLSMLNACSLGIAVVNIDNGFGAAVYAHLILNGSTTRGQA